MSEDRTGLHWLGFDGTDRDGDGDPQSPEGPYGFYGVASCGASCGTGEQRDIYEEAVANEAYIAHLVMEREEAAFDEYVEYLVQQRENSHEPNAKRYD